MRNIQTKPFKRFESVVKDTNGFAYFKFLSWLKGAEKYNLTALNKFTRHTNERQKTDQVQSSSEFLSSRFFCADFSVSPPPLLRGFLLLLLRSFSSFIALAWKEKGLPRKLGLTALNMFWLTSGEQCLDFLSFIVRINCLFSFAVQHVDCCRC